MRPVSFFVAALLIAGCGGGNSDASSANGGSPTTNSTSTGGSGGSDNGGGGGTSQGGGGGSGGTGGSAAEPIIAPADTWTWVDFPESKCASGTATGIGVNLHPGATDVIIFFEGGGACTSATTCWGPSPGATNLAGFDATTFKAAEKRMYPILQRDVPTNPLREQNMVFVPYCTGDLHAGTKEVDMMVNGATKKTYFYGLTDLDLFLARLAPTFPKAKRVWSAGASAGGFATFLTFDHVAKAFKTRVDMIDDSGPPILANGASSSKGLFEIWGFVPSSTCSPCETLGDVLTSDRKSQPKSRYGFLSFDVDTTISSYFGYTLAEYPQQITDVQTTIAGDANAATYIVYSEQSHVVETDPALLPNYMPWITQLVNDDPAWTSTDYGKP